MSNHQADNPIELSPELKSFALHQAGYIRASFSSSIPSDESMFLTIEYLLQQDHLPDNIMKFTPHMLIVAYQQAALERIAKKDGLKPD